MTDWPVGLRVAPIREWPGALTPASQRIVAPFRRNGRYVKDATGRKVWKYGEAMPLSDTLRIMRRELDALRARNAELLVAIPASQFRQDGKPYANAKSEHPGVILSFDSRVGHLSYPCDTFTTWEDNLRGIVLALEALRKVDRYGVTSHGEQYRGFAAIEAAPSAGFRSIKAATQYLLDVMGDTRQPEQVKIGPDLRQLLRMAQRVAHPDHGGSSEEFQRVADAEQLLRGEHLI